MLSKVVAVSQEEFDKWYQTKDADPPGLQVIKFKGCASCHTVDGRPLVGRSFKGIYGQTHTFSNASPTVVDENYIRQSILEPQARIVASYEPVMPTYQGPLKDAEITAIIEYLKAPEGASDEE